MSSMKPPRLMLWFQNMASSRNIWHLCLQERMNGPLVTVTHSPVRGNHTNNFCEAAMRIVKDKVLYRMKAFNVTQLVHFMVTRFEMYYKHRLTDLANNRMSNLVNSKFFLKDHEVNSDNIEKIDDSNYRVRSFSTGTTEVVYDVNMDVGTYTCPVGKTGGPCKHQHAVMRAYNLQGSNFVPVSSPKHRQMFYYIATGRADLDETWFSSLDGMVDVPLPTNPADNPSETTAAEDMVASTASTSDLCSSRSLNLQRDLQNRFGQRDRPAGTTRSNSSLDVHSQCEENLPEKQQLKALFQSFEQKLSDPIFKPAIQCFLKKCKKMKSGSAMVSSLYTFGNYTGAASIAAKHLKKRARIRRCLQTQIGVQPIAVARRKTALGGRRALITGRLSKGRNRADYLYSKQRSQPGRGSSPFSCPLCF